MQRALSCPLEEDLRPLIRFLRSRGVVHRVAEENGMQVLWVVDEQTADIVRSLHQRDLSDMTREPDRGIVETPTSAYWRQSYRLIPVTLLVLLVTAVVAALTGLGSNLDNVVLLTYT
ncbi:MAG: rhomboid protease N-terminal domain-containing protein, partial [Pseudomonas neustonica]